MSAEIKCLGCGSVVGLQSEVPVPDRCDQCPPWTCDSCGQTCSMAKPCSCWISLEGLPLADIKGLLAFGDLSVEADR